MRKKKEELSNEEIKDIIVTFKKEKDVKIYTPLKYFSGLTKEKDVIQRLNEFVRNKNNDYKYDKVNFETDKIPVHSKKPSRYTKLFMERFGGKDASIEMSDEFKSKVTGVPLKIIEKVKKKGFGAYTSGHRVGVSAQAWANARVNSFLTLGCTAMTVDEKLLYEVYQMRKSKKREKFFNQPISCDNKKKIPEYLINGKYKKK